MICVIMDDNEEVNKVLLHITDELDSISEELGEENFKKVVKILSAEYH